MINRLEGCDWGGRSRALNRSLRDMHGVFFFFFSFFSDFRERSQRESGVTMSGGIISRGS